MKYKCSIVFLSGNRVCSGHFLRQINQLGKGHLFIGFFHSPLFKQLAVICNHVARNRKRKSVYITALFRMVKGFISGVIDGGVNKQIRKIV